MFLREYHRTKDGKRHTYFALVESHRTLRGPRQCIVAQLGELTPDQQRRWQRTAIFHSRHEEGREPALFPDEAIALKPGERAGSPDDPDVVRVRLDKVGWTNARAFGDVWLGLQLWKKLGLDEIVARHVPQGRETVPPAGMVAIEVISRLCVGNGGETSEFALAEHGYRRTALEDLLGVPDEVVTKDRLYHEVFAGNMNDATAFPTIVETMEKRFGKAQRVWVVDRGIASEKNISYLKEHQQSYLVGTPRSQLTDFEAELCTKDWYKVRDAVEVKTIRRDEETYVLARSKQRRLKERAIRKRQLVGWHGDLKMLAARVAKGHLKDADKVVEQVGRLRERWPAASKFASVEVPRDDGGQATRVTWHYDRSKLKSALARDGAYLLLSDQTDWSPEQLWSTYMQLTCAEEAFRSMKSHLLLRPMWHQLSGRIQAHVFVCVLSYALWKALDHMLHHAGLMTHIGKPDPLRPNASPKDRPMSPAAALRLLHDVPIGDILLTTVDGRTLRLRRVARPNPTQTELLTALKLNLPERLCADRQVTDLEALGLPTERIPSKM